MELCNEISFDAYGNGGHIYSVHDVRIGSKNACKVWYAAKTNDISICEDIQADHFIDPESCIISVAVWNNEPPLCENIEGKRLAFADFLKQHSKSECYYKVAVTYYDIDLCNKVSEEGTLLTYDNIGGEIKGKKLFKREDCIRSVKEALKLGYKKGERDKSTTPNQMW